MAAAGPGLFSMEPDELSNGAEAPGEAGGDREWRVAAAIFTPRRQAHSLLRNAGDAECPCGIGDKWRQHAATPSRGAAMPLRLAVLVLAHGEADRNARPRKIRLVRIANLIGGGQCEERLDILLANLARHGVSNIRDVIHTPGSAEF